MKKNLLVICICLSSMMALSQEWMSNLDVAKRLATVQNKMILMIWEDASINPFPVSVYDEKGNKIYFRDLFVNESVNQLVWDHFVPVVVSEDKYNELYNEIEDKRSVLYMQKFNDDYFKVMDVNGNILNIDEPFFEILNLSDFIARYYVDTTFLKGELINYSKQKDVYTTFRLAAKYIDACFYVNDDVKDEMMMLSNIYLQEAKERLLDEDVNDKQLLSEKIALQEMKQLLLREKPRRVLKLLKKATISTEDASNRTMIAFLKFTAYLMLKDEKSASPFRAQLTILDIKKANLLIN